MLWPGYIQHATRLPFSKLQQNNARPLPGANAPDYSLKIQSMELIPGNKYMVLTRRKSQKWVLHIYNGQDMGRSHCFVPVHGLGFVRIQNDTKLINELVKLP